MGIPQNEMLLKLEPIIERIDSITRDLNLQEIAIVISAMVSATVCQFEEKEQERRLVELMVFAKQLIASTNKLKDE